MDSSQLVLPTNGKLRGSTSSFLCVFQESEKWCLIAEWLNTIASWAVVEC